MTSAPARRRPWWPLLLLLTLPVMVAWIVWAILTADAEAARASIDALPVPAPSTAQETLDRLESQRKRVSDELDQDVRILQMAAAAGIGTGGLITLGTVMHRQALQAQAHLLQERTAATGEHDAEQKRITELYIKATEQLGSDKPAVRLAALHALDRLGREHADHRRVIVDVWCAYLRMPPSTEDAPPPGDDVPPAWPPGELQVRATALGLLGDRLRATLAGAPESSWGPLHVNLAGTHLERGDFRNCAFDGADFTGTTFGRSCAFTGAVFTGPAVFTDARFLTGATFGAVDFRRHADFTGARISAEAWFWNAHFSDATFDGARFLGRADFDKASFTGLTRFKKANFAGVGSFNGAGFAEPADLTDVTFGEAAVFTSARFHRSARFVTILFLGDARFDKTAFEGPTWFSDTEFGGATTFDGAAFGARPEFSGCRSLRPELTHTWPKGWRLGPDAGGPGRPVERG